MAVLVRAGRTMIPALSRALVAAGVPVEVAGDEIPLAADPAVRPLLLALRVAAAGPRTNAEEAQALLTSPLGGLDSMATRRLGRALREAERAELAGTGLPRGSGELVAPRCATRPARRRPTSAELDRGPTGGSALLADCERADPDRAAPPRRACGGSGRGPAGRSGCGTRPRRGGEPGPAGQP